MYLVRIVKKTITITNKTQILINTQYTEKEVPTSLPLIIILIFHFFMLFDYRSQAGNISIFTLCLVTWRAGTRVISFVLSVGTPSTFYNISRRYVCNEILTVKIISSYLCCVFKCISCHDDYLYPEWSVN